DGHVTGVQTCALPISAREGIIDIMKRQKYTERIPAGLPDGTIVAHKTGSIKGVRNDAGIVYPKDGQPYVIALLSKGVADERGGRSEERRVGKEGRGGG